MIRQLLIIMLCFISLFAYAHTSNDTYIFASASDSKRFQLLTKEIRCVVCQNQNIADSNAPLANDLRRKIYFMVRNHQPDNEIKDYLVKRYGEFILLEPRFNHSTWLLWLFPLIAILFALFFIRRLVVKP